MEFKVFDSLLEPTFVLDAEGRVLYCNEPASLICEISVRKIMRSRPYIKELVLFTEDVDALKHVGQIQDPQPYQEVSFKTESGKSGRVQLTIQPLHNPPAEGAPPLPATQWLLFFRDVTLEETLQRKYRAELEKKEHVIAALEEAQKKLEDYSRNLEKMVAERTAQLSQINAQMKALLDSLGQGFLIFNAQGLCLDIASKACEVVLECDPRGKKISDVLRFSEAEAKSFTRWMATAFAEMLPFEDLCPLAPPTYHHSGGRNIDLGYFPIRDQNGTIEGLVLVGTDVTDLVAAQKQAQSDRAQSQMIIELVKNRRQVLGFIREADDLVQEIHNELAKPKPGFEVAFRALHTLKGGAASFSIQGLVDCIHEGEDLLGHWHNAPDESGLRQLRQQSAKIQKSYSEFLAGTESILGTRGANQAPVREVRLHDLQVFYQQLFSHPDLREHFFTHFMVEKSSQIFAHFNDTIQTTASQVGKIVSNLVIEDPDFELWPEPYQKLISTLVHAFRNAVDHGIEAPDVREQVGKPTAGRISFRAQRHDQVLKFIIQDDGAGIDPQKIRKSLAGKGIDVVNESDAQVIQHVFDSEFSTRDQITALSGRGVGMDAIRSCAQELGGYAHVESKIGQGTSCIVTVPWLEQWSQPRAKAA